MSHDHQSEDATTRPRRRWPWIISLPVALTAGIGIGATTVEPLTVEVPGEIPQSKLDYLERRAGELEKRQQDLEFREGQVAESEAALDDREAAITKQEEIVAANSVGDGIWTVGVDISPGTYRSMGVPSDCYWGIYRSGSNGMDIVENGIPGGGNPTVTLSEGQDFESQRCGEWRKQ